MKLSAKITGGFGLLILVAMLLGGLAVVKMGSVKTVAAAMTTKNVPSVQVANNVERYSLLTMYAARGYALSEEESYEKEARKNLDEVFGYLKAAHELAQKEKMDELEKAAGAAEAKAKAYGDLFAETKALIGKMDEDRKDMNKAELDRDIALGRLASEMGKINKPPRVVGAGGEGKLPPIDRDAAAMAKQIIDLESANPDDPKLPALKKKLVALEKIIATTKTTESGPGKLGTQSTQIFVGAARDASAEARKRLYLDPVMRTNDPAAMNKRYRELYAESIQGKFPGAPLSELLAQMPAEDLGSVAASTAGKPATQKALPMPASKDDLKTNQLYNTSQGLAIWNGKNFVAQ
jgi:hypothetical protein